MSCLHHFESKDYPAKGNLWKKSDKCKTKSHVGEIITLYLLQLLQGAHRESLCLISCAAQDRWKFIYF